MTRTEKLAKKISKIYTKNGEEIAQLETSGPRGGNNARTIEGWANIGNGTITRAVKLAGVPTMKYWSGSAPTASTALPACILEDCYDAYYEIF